MKGLPQSIVHNKFYYSANGFSGKLLFCNFFSYQNFCDFWLNNDKHPWSIKDSYVLDVQISRTTNFKEMQDIQ